MQVRGFSQINPLLTLGKPVPFQWNELMSRRKTRSDATREISVKETPSKHVGTEAGCEFIR